MKHIAAGRYQNAIEMLHAYSTDPRLLNIKGVCLLRTGQYSEAVRVFRNFVLNAGCTWMRRDLPAVYKLNFATALLVAGHPAGCLDMLLELNDASHPTVQKLKAAIKRWEQNLPFWKRWNWKLGQIEPQGHPVTLDFAPGEFEWEPTQPDNPSPVTPGSSLRTAA